MLLIINQMNNQAQMHQTSANQVRKESTEEGINQFRQKIQDYFKEILSSQMKCLNSYSEKIIQFYKKADPCQKEHILQYLQRTQNKKVLQKIKQSQAVQQYQTKSLIYQVFEAIIVVVGFIFNPFYNIIVSVMQSQLYLQCCYPKLNSNQIANQKIANLPKQQCKINFQLLSVLKSPQNNWVQISYALLTILLFLGTAIYLYRQINRNLSKTIVWRIIRKCLYFCSFCTFSLRIFYTLIKSYVASRALICHSQFFYNQSSKEFFINQTSFDVFSASTPNITFKSIILSLFFVWWGLCIVVLLLRPNRSILKQKP